MDVIKKIENQIKMMILKYLKSFSLIQKAKAYEKNINLRKPILREIEC